LSRSSGVSLDAEVFVMGMVASIVGSFSKILQRPALAGQRL